MSIIETFVGGWWMAGYGSKAVIREIRLIGRIRPIADGQDVEENSLTLAP